MNLDQAILTDHAQFQLARRHLDHADIMSVLADPESVDTIRPGRVVAQRLIGNYLFRVFVDTDRFPPEIVTAYRSSRFQRYRKPR
ncbi:MAG: DUF4258 domain-containing protein [Pirellulales bacterium]|nr:DUF4258 domain-containing protein [Pirellulales bacterium]